MNVKVCLVISYYSALLSTFSVASEQNGGSKDDLTQSFCELRSFSLDTPILNLENVRGRNLNFATTRRLYKEVFPRLARTVIADRGRRNLRFDSVDQAFDALSALVSGQNFNVGVVVSHLDSILSKYLTVNRLKGQASSEDQKVELDDEFAALSLIYNHPRLMLLLAGKLLTSSNLLPSQRLFPEPQDVIRDFIAQIILEMQGEKGPLTQELEKLSTYHLSSVNVIDSETKFPNETAFADFLYGVISVSGKVAFPVKLHSPDRYVFAANRLARVGMSSDEQYLFRPSLSELNQSHRLLDLVTILDFWINRSARWDRADLWPRPESIVISDSGVETLKIFLLTRFYFQTATESWMPPKGVKIVSKMGLTMTLEVESLKGLLALDNDLRLQGFQVSNDSSLP